MSPLPHMLWPLMADNAECPLTCSQGERMAALLAGAGGGHVAALCPMASQPPSLLQTWETKPRAHLLTITARQWDEPRVPTHGAVDWPVT